MRRCWRALIVLVLALVATVATTACTFSADYAGTGYRCDDGVTCPSGQTCAFGVCVLPGPDAATTADGSASADAAPDAPIAPLPDAGPACGDGVVTGSEECDDTDDSDADGCLSTCRFASCGDGFVRTGVEECDDGNTADGDGCSSSCLSCAQGEAQLTWPAAGHCYTRHDLTVDWSAARAACTAMGAHLVTFASLEESMALDGTLLPGDVNRWIGLDDADVEASFRWVTGEPLAFTLWGMGQPDDFDVGEDCVEDRADFTWNDQNCGALRGYVCEQDGWTIRPDDRHAYRTFYAPLDWPAAQAACAALGGHLATLTSAGEQAFVAPLVDVRAWIGLTDVAVEGTFAWVTGEAFGYTSWGPGEPNAIDPSDDCVKVNHFGDDSWSDDPCGLAFAYVCEID